MDAATIAILAIVVALVWAIINSRSTKPQPKVVVALKPSVAAASVLAPRGSATLLEDSTDPKSGGGSATAMVASSPGAYDIV